MNFPSKRSNSGFTLIEMLISLALMGVLMMFAGLVGTSGRGAFESASLNVDVDQRGSRALDRVVSELVQVSQLNMFPSPAGQFGTGVLNFQQANGINAGVPTLGALTSIGFENAADDPDDGVDNNGNGLVDEGVVVLTRNVGGPTPLRIILCRNVSEFLEGELPGNGDNNGNGVWDENGFNIQQIGDVLTVRLSVEGAGPEGEMVVRTLESSVRLRN